MLDNKEFQVKNVKIELPDIMSCDEVKKMMLLLNQGDFITKFVGGCVRDVITGKIPADVDIATNINTKTLKEILLKNDFVILGINYDYGLIQVLINQDIYEIAALRRDIQSNGRHSVVYFTNKWDEDSVRRDFTINSLYCDIEGNVYDYFDGYNDVKNGELKFIGNPNKRIEEDLLRILRYYRFYNEYYNHNDDATNNAIKKFNPQLSDLSGYRIAQEMFKILSLVDPYKTLELMHQNGSLEALGIKLDDISSFKNLVKLEKITQMNKIQPLIRLAALISKSDNPRVTTMGIFEKWKLENNEGFRLYSLTDNAKIPPNVSKKDMLGIIVDLGKTLAENLLYVSTIVNNDLTEDDLNKYADLIEFTRKTKVPEFPINSVDVNRFDIYKNSVLIGDHLEKAKKWWQLNDFRPEKQHIINWVESSILTEIREKSAKRVES